MFHMFFRGSKASFWVARVWKSKAKTLKLYKAVDIDGCSWTLGSGQIVVTLEKCAAEPWPQLLKEVEGLYL